MDSFYFNSFAYRRSPDNFLSSALQDFQNQDPSTADFNFLPATCGSMATTDYLRPSNPPSSPPSNHTTHPSRITSPRGLAISMAQPLSTSNRQADDRLQQSGPTTTNSVNATSTYSAPTYNEEVRSGKAGQGGLGGAQSGVSGEVWKSSPHAEGGRDGNLESAIGEPDSFRSGKTLGLGLGYPEDDGRNATSSLGSTLAEGGRLGYSSATGGPYQATPSSQGLPSSSYNPETPAPNASTQSVTGGSAGRSSSEAGSSIGSGRRASGLPIETVSPHSSSRPSPHNQFQHQPPTPTPSGQSSRSEPIQVHTFFPDNGEAGVPVTIVATINKEWASKIGLELADGGFSSENAKGRIVVTFGSEDVEAKVERSFSSPEDGASHSSFNVNITVVAPAFAKTLWTSTRVPLIINLAGLEAKLARQALPGGGKEVGEYTYWLVSPRSSLKRFAEISEDEIDSQNPSKQTATALRRPASYPALAGATSSGTAASSLGLGPVASSVGRSNGTTLNRSVSHNRNASSSSAAAFNPPTHTMRHYRSDMGMNSPSQSSYGNGSPAVGSGDFTFSVRPNSINLPQSAFSMGPRASGTVSPGGLSRPETLMDGSDSRPATANSNSTTTHSPGLYDERQLGHSTSMNSLSGSFNAMRRGSSQFSPVPGGSSTFASSSSLNPSQASKPSKPPKPAASAPATVKAGSRAVLQMHGELQDMAVGWSHDEYLSSRRLVQFWRRQDGTTIHMTFRPILPSQYVQNSIVVSCIFREDKNECFITSVDLIYLLEALVASRFTIEEKNRIRRNLEGFKPATVNKGKEESAEFFKVIMDFPNPKPRNIEKDVKVFAWSILDKALSKIIGKYSAAIQPPTSQPASASSVQTSPSQPEGNRQGSRRVASNHSNFSASTSSGPYSDSSPHPDQSQNQGMGSAAFGHFSPQSGPTFNGSPSQPQFSSGRSAQSYDYDQSYQEYSNPPSSNGPNYSSGF